MVLSCRIRLRSLKEVGFHFGGSEVAELSVEALLVEPGDPAACRELEVVEAAPVPAVGFERGGVAPQFGFEQADGCLGARVVVAATGRGCPAGEAVPAVLGLARRAFKPEQVFARRRVSEHARVTRRR